MENGILIHIPHSSVHIPAYVRKNILLNDDDLERELLAMTDKYTDELFISDGAVYVKNAYSRLVFDPERFREDKDESMAAYGMGAIYVSALDGRALRMLTHDGREEMLARFYDPYHKRLEEETGRMLDLYGKCLIADGHSFPEKPLPFEQDKNPDRPDICIGTCSFHTPERLASCMEDYIKRHGMSVKRNSPFSGTIVPMKYYRSERGVMSVMIEINRRLYMDEASGAKLPCFASVRSFIMGLLSEMSQCIV